MINEGKTEKIIYFNSTTDIVSSNIAEYIKTIGYTPVFSIDIDLTSEKDVSDFFESYKDNLCGAILSNPPVIHGNIENTTDEMWNRARDTFALPMLNITQIVGKIFMQKRKGSIIYLNSIHADKPTGDGFLYTTGCAAVQMLCREAAIIYGSYGVGCYNIMRGIVEGEEGYFTSDYSSIHHNSELRFPKERVPSADSLNELCEFLLSDSAYILNGSDLHADEGFRLFYGKSGFYK